MSSLVSPEQFSEAVPGHVARAIACATRIIDLALLEHAPHIEVRASFEGGTRYATMDRDWIAELRDQESDTLASITIDTQLDEFRLAMTDWMRRPGRAREISTRFYVPPESCPIAYHPKAGRGEGVGGSDALQGWILSKARRNSAYIAVPNYNFWEGADDAENAERASPGIDTYVYTRRSAAAVGVWFTRRHAISEYGASYYAQALAPRSSEGDKELLSRSVETYHAAKISAVLGALEMVGGNA